MIEVRHAPERLRYEIAVDGDVAGFATYLRHEGRFVFDDTSIEDRFSGQGLGSRLAQGALDDVRANGGRIVPLCPFMTRWLAKHPEYTDLVDAELLARMESSA